jgi:hypothetical protein
VKKRLSFGTAILTMLETGFDKGGEYLREIAVLVIVFIPLDLWKHTEITAFRVATVILISFAIFLGGMVLEWTSYGVKRGKIAWEREESHE